MEPMHLHKISGLYVDQQSNKFEAREYAKVFRADYRDAKTTLFMKVTVPLHPNLISAIY